MTTESGWNRETGLAGLAGDLYLAAGSVRRALNHVEESEAQLQEAQQQLSHAQIRYAAARAALQEGVAGGEQ